MKLTTYSYRGITSIGRIDGESIVDLHAADAALPSTMLELLRGGPAMLARAREAHGAWHTLPLAEASLLAPIPNPSKYLAIGMNFKKHVAEAAKVGVKTPPTQVWFNKQVSCINGPTGDIHMPRVSGQLDYEVELGVVIGRRCRHVRAEDARTPTMTVGKSFETCGPIGPWLVTDDEVPDPHALRLRTWVNGELRQDDDTANMIHDIYAQIAYLSTAFTLEPGDLIATGTPSGVGVAMDPPSYLKVGDVVRCEVDGIGAIENRVVPEPA